MTKEQKISELMKKNDYNMGQISDGYHTFNELYYHRMALFSVICHTYKDKAWKSWLHDDGTMYDDYFIVGINTPGGQYTYHYHKDHWDFFSVKELEYAPKYDGHKPIDIDRLHSLLYKAKCTYCIGIKNSTPGSPKRKYKYCPMCGTKLK